MAMDFIDRQDTNYCPNCDGWGCKNCICECWDCVNALFEEDLCPNGRIYNLRHA